MRPESELYALKYNVLLFICLSFYSVSVSKNKTPDVAGGKAGLWQGECLFLGGLRRRRLEESQSRVQECLGVGPEQWQDHGALGISASARGQVCSAPTFSQEGWVCPENSPAERGQRPKKKQTRREATEKTLETEHSSERDCTPRRFPGERL